MLQTELHPRFQQRELVEYARKSGVRTIMAHCPLAHGSPRLLGDRSLQRLAEARGGGSTAAQLCLRWSVENGFVPIPKASSRRRMDENLAALSMAPLSPEERATIDALDVEAVLALCVDPAPPGCCILHISTYGSPQSPLHLREFTVWGVCDLHQWCKQEAHSC